MIRPTRREDSAAILEMIREGGQFDDAGLAHVGQVLASHLAGERDEIWLTADDADPVGVAYCAPEVVAPDVWNLLMLWTRPDRHGTGIGRELVAEVERLVRDRRARLLIVETSSLLYFAPARKFYDKCGFTLEASISNYFAPGDDKLIYTKSVAAPPRAG
jgi:ribosomal protein S18 acetylase RimI-like enzyme